LIPSPPRLNRRERFFGMGVDFPLFPFSPLPGILQIPLRLERRAPCLLGNFRNFFFPGLFTSCASFPFPSATLFCQSQPPYSPVLLLRLRSVRRVHYCHSRFCSTSSPSLSLTNHFPWFQVCRPSAPSFFTKLPPPPFLLPLL